MKISPAHQMSTPFRIDPFYAENTTVRRRKLHEWLYGHYEYEALLLQKMRRETVDAKLNVEYPGEFYAPHQLGYFKSMQNCGELHFYAAGNVRVLLNSHEIYSSPDSSKLHKVTISHTGEAVLQLSADDPCRDVPALLPVSNSTAAWLYSLSPEGIFAACTRVPGTCDQPPHRNELPQFALEPRRIAPDKWDAEVEVFAFVHISNAASPAMFVGESPAEAENSAPQGFEQSNELVPESPGCWRSKVPLALRYIRLTNAPEAKVTLRVLIFPASYKGAFAATDNPELTEIWMKSAYTLRLCMRNFMLDGIKRDRLPWAGDLAVSLISNAFSFAEREPVRNSLSILCSAGIGRKHVNGITDYSLWYIINHHLYQLYFGDPDFLKFEYPRIVETMDILREKCDIDNFLPGKTNAESIVFIDWTPGDKTAALQILWHWALTSAARLAARMNDARRQKEWHTLAGRLKKRIREKFFDRQSGLFTSRPGSSEKLRHANMFAILTGVANKRESRKIAGILTRKTLPPVGTPYMAAFEVLALAEAGKNKEALDRLSEIWGGMLKTGATTFYEAYKPGLTGNELYTFYRRPFGLSLCHAWSSGPVFLLPFILAGLRPEEDGWRKVEMKLSGLVKNFALTVPTPYGDILLSVKDGRADIRMPSCD